MATAGFQQRMRPTNGLVWTAVAVGVVCLLCAGGIFFYSQATADEISPGITVGGVDVGGMDAASAKAVLERRASAQAQTPIVVTAGPRQFGVVAAQWKLAVDTDSAVAQALSRTHTQSVFTRLFDSISGQAVHADIAPSLAPTPADAAVAGRAHQLVDRPAQQPTVTVDQTGKASVASAPGVAADTTGLDQALASKLLNPGSAAPVAIPTVEVRPAATVAGDELARATSRAHGLLDHSAQSARVIPTGDTLNVTDSSDGRSVDDTAFQNGVNQALAQGGTKQLAVPVRTVHPSVTRDQLAQQYPYYITINRSSFQLHLFKNLQEVHTYRIAVGMVGLQTPAGPYKIQNKSTDPAWYVPNAPWAGPQAGKVIPPNAPDNPIKARWMGIADGAGIHGTDDLGSLGSAASHGCIRMTIPDVVDLFNQVPAQTPVFIA